LTAKQKKVYTAIETYIRLKGIPPTVREIGEMVGEKTPGAVQGILNRLEQKGVIKRQLGAARSIQLVSPDSQLYSDPVYIPEIKKISKRNIDDLLNIYNISKFHPFPSSFVNADGKYFMLPCPDESLAEKGIRPEDILFINTAAMPDKGDIILVFYEGRTYLRYYFPEEGTSMVTLTADENLLDKTVFSPDEFKIIGRLEGKYSKI
jgi:repressor LexA